MVPVNTSESTAAPSPTDQIDPGGGVIETLRVSAGSRPTAVAGAIAALLRQEGAVEVQAIGPHAVNQAVKALAITRSYLVDDALDLTAAPSFVKLELHDEERTALRFHIRAIPAEEGAPGVGSVRASVVKPGRDDPDVR
jgi:stage V sporulation protein S